MGLIHMIFGFVGASFRRQGELDAENLAPLQHLTVLEQGSNRPRLRNRDRIFWTRIAHLWGKWRSVVHIVQPCVFVNNGKHGFSAVGHCQDATPGGQSFYLRPWMGWRSRSKRPECISGPMRRASTRHIYGNRSSYATHLRLECASPGQEHVERRRRREGQCHYRNRECPPGKAGR